jgi:2-haloacid dehalogenase
LPTPGRAEYQPALEEIRRGRQGFSKLDVLHRRNLERILPRFGVTALASQVLDSLNLAWHRLDAWPDCAGGLARLRRRYVIAPVSNGNISLMVALARRNGFVWDAVLGAELASDYKPVAYGGGKPLFHDLKAVLKLKLLAATTYDTGA